MNRSSQTPITDELLSAYIDGLVTDEEKARIEAAVATDPRLAWELDTLRQTVELMRELPAIPLPRSFLLREEQVADVLAERRQRAGATAGVHLPPAPARPGVTTSPVQRRPVSRQTDSFWQGLLAFFNSGNLLLRNAAAVAALFLVVVWAITPGGPTAQPLAAPAPEAQFFAAASDAQPAAQAEAAAEPAAEEAIVEESAPAAVEESPPAEKAGPDLSTSAATVTEAPIAQAAPPGPGPMEAAAGPNVRSIGPEGMRSGSEAALGEGIGGGGEIGPMAMQGVPADAAGMEAPVAVTGVGDVPGEAQPENAAKLPPAEEAAAPAPTESAAEESADAEPTLAPSAVASSQKVAAPEEMAAQPAMAEAQSPTQQAEAPTLWRTTQTLLAGLVLLLALLWLLSRRSRPTG